MVQFKLDGIYIDLVSGKVAKCENMIHFYTSIHISGFLDFISINYNSHTIGQKFPECGAKATSCECNSSGFSY
jgi:hypothetical protein